MVSDPASRILFQRDGSLLVTGGTGQDRLLTIARLCGRLRSVIAGNYVFEFSTLAVWGAVARGLTAADVIGRLADGSDVGVPGVVAARIAETAARYGALRLDEQDGVPVLVASDPLILAAIGLPGAGGHVALDRSQVGEVILAATKAGWPVVDSRIHDGPRRTTQHTNGLRPYQRDAFEAFMRVGSGTVVLPCGSGKTVVGAAAAAAVSSPTLVLVPSRTVAEQWHSALIEHTGIRADRVLVAGRMIGHADVVITTYHAASSGRLAGELLGRSWELVIYDEVQSLPADVFRLAALLQARRRLGLTATLVREDGREVEVAALVGPTVYEASWLELERDGWIAPAHCIEVRLPAVPAPRDQVRFKLAAIDRLLELHAGEATLVVGTDIASLERAAGRLSFPVLTGQSTQDERDSALRRFRVGDVTVLGMSRIGSVGIDLPNASVLIQLSGTYGSRQEEAQRLGRILRPRPGKTAHFYTLVVEGTREVDFAAKRQRYLVNLGYSYDIMDASDLPRRDRQRTSSPKPDSAGTSQSGRGGNH